MKLNAGQFLKKSITPARWNHFLGFFADIAVRGNSFLLLGETKFSSNPSLRLVYTDFVLMLNRAVFPVGESSFWASWKRIYFNESFIPVGEIKVFV